MHSRAFMLLEKEWFKLQKDELPWGIQARPLNEDDMFTWEGTIKGPKDTQWEGGVFKLYLQFDEQYNHRPPRVYFHTIPFHPNVDPETGQVCADFLDDLNHWKESFSVTYILLSMQIMLPNPIIEEAVNPIAARIFATSPSGFRQTVLDCVLASKRVEAGLKPHAAEDIDLTRVSPVENEISNLGSTEENNKTLGKVAKLSFDDYHAMWSGIATTKPVADSRNPLSEVLKADSKLQATHFGLPHQELQDEIHRQLTEHNAIMYGNFEAGRAGQDLAELKATKIQLLKQIYLPKQPGPASLDSPTPRPVPSAPSPSIVTVRDLEPPDQEVDDLLAWTDSLP